MDNGECIDLFEAVELSTVIVFRIIDNDNKITGHQIDEGCSNFFFSFILSSSSLNPRVVAQRTKASGTHSTARYFLLCLNEL